MDRVNSCSAWAAVSLMALSGLLGCKPSKSVYGVADGGSSWTNVVDDATPGIDAGSVSIITLKAGPAEGLTFVIWSDLPNGREGSGSGSAQGATYKGEHTSNDGRRISYAADTKNGVNGTIKIDSTNYDLKNGTAFLISTQSGQPVVEQVQLDITKLRTAGDDIHQFGKGNAMIREFFEQQRPQPQTSHQGRWQATSATLAGAAFPEAVTSSIVLTVESDRYEVLVGGNPDSGTCAVDASQSPAQMTINGTKGPNQGKTMLAIYEFPQADEMNICYNLKGDSFPTEFTSTAENGYFLVTYKRGE